MDARSLFVTPNTTTVYVFTCLDLKNGPMVMQVPPGVLGPVDDAYFRWVTDVGLTGPDAGKGGKYLFVPPGHTDSFADRYFIFRPRTNRTRSPGSPLPRGSVPMGRNGRPGPVTKDEAGREGQHKD